VKEGYATEKVKDGVFQAMMEVALVNDGPVYAFLFFPWGPKDILANSHLLGHIGAYSRETGGRGSGQAGQYLMTTGLIAG
jgi:hypothetical protein